MTGTEAHVEAFDCPRCGRLVDERFWGPCAACREELVASYASAPTGEPAVGTGRFEPAMHVVPNHVATKD